MKHIIGKSNQKETNHQFTYEFNVCANMNGILLYRVQQCGGNVLQCEKLICCDLIWTIYVFVA